MSAPLAYHITWTTHGSWLHGDAPGWVMRGVPGIQKPDEARREHAAAALTEEPVSLDEMQRRLVEQSIRESCRIRGWTIHALNVRTNHVHLVVTARERPEDVMRVLKQWSSKALSDHLGLPVVNDKKKGRKRWFTVHGSTKWINDPGYFENAVRYVNEGQ